MVPRLFAHPLSLRFVNPVHFIFLCLSLLLPTLLRGQGNFLPGVNYPVEDVAAGFAVGDINGDKKPDVIVANLDGRETIDGEKVIAAAIELGWQPETRCSVESDAVGNQ
jgi:hypothetical protein